MEFIPKIAYKLDCSTNLQFCFLYIIPLKLPRKYQGGSKNSENVELKKQASIEEWKIFYPFSHNNQKNCIIFKISVI